MERTQQRIIPKGSIQVMKKPTFNDFRDAKPTEIMSTYKMTSGQLEMAHRDVCYGANQVELRGEYEKFYRRNRRDV